jgi:hypothetical protein
MRRDEAKASGLLRPGHEEEDLVTYALYPKVAPKFLKGEAEEEIIEVAPKSESTEDELKIAAIAAALSRFIKKTSPKMITAETKTTISPWKLAALRDGLG